MRVFFRISKQYKQTALTLSVRYFTENYVRNALTAPEKILAMSLKLLKVFFIQRIWRLKLNFKLI